MLLLAEIAVLFVAPVLLIKLYRGTPRFRLLLFVAALLGIVAVGLIHGLTLYQMGFRLDTALQATILYVPFTVLSMLCLLLFAVALGAKQQKPWKYDPFFVPAALLLSAGQQLVYQGVLLQLLLLQYSTGVAVVVTAFLYAFLHILFPRPLFNLAFTFVGGLVFAWIYVVEPNFLVASVAHTILNITAVTNSLVAFLDERGLLERTI